MSLSQDPFVYSMSEKGSLKERRLGTSDLVGQILQMSQFKPAATEHNKHVKPPTVPFLHLKCQFLLMQDKLVVMVTWPVAG